MKRLGTLLPAVLAGSVALISQPTQAATFTWGNATNNWSVGSAWAGNVAPTGTNPLDVLVFGGNVGVVGSATTWVATNTVAATPFRLNQITLNGIDQNNLNSGLSHTIQGLDLRFGGTNPQILQNGSANTVINTALNFAGELRFAGSGDAFGPGTVTINAGIHGIGNIVKSGSSTFRFGTLPAGLPAQTPSTNTWMGELQLEEGTIRFNNNAQSAASALRANPIVFVGEGILSARRDNSDQTNGFETSFRMGTVSGAGGSIFAGVEGSNVSNYDVVITALRDGDFGGTIQLQGPTGAGDDGGDLVIRGTNNQTFSGTMLIHKDIVIGRGATMTLTNNATLAGQASGALTMAGGTVVLDNTFANAPLTGGLDMGRLRDSTADSTTMESIGGGTLRLIGNASGTQEETGRLQLGSYSNGAAESKSRSGHLILQVQSMGGATALRFKSYSRDERTLLQFATVEFTGLNSAGSVVNLGTASNQIFLNKSLEVGAFTVPLFNGLLNVTDSTTNSVGWATINTTSGPQFATHSNSTGVGPVATVAWSTSLAASANARITGSVNTPSTATTYVVNSIRMGPTTGGQVLTIGGNDTLSSTAFLLAGAFDFAIQATGTGSIGGNSTRFFHVPTANLTVDAPITGSAKPIVKAGEGTLTLNHINNQTLNQVVAINGGALRATPGASLPQGELRLRGGQLEIQGGGTFSRNIGLGANNVNWSGVELIAGVPTAVSDDRGSGGFGAFGADASIDLGTAGPTLISWEDLGFVRSGFALTFGSRSATHRITWTDNLSLSAADPNAINYNAREIRVLNNPASSGDVARISGTISGRQQNDLLKTGQGDLELTGINTYTGATIVQEGRLFVNGESQTSFLHKVNEGGTLSGRGKVGNVLVDAGGIIAPGAAITTASVLQTKDLQFTDATSVFSVELGGATPGGDSTTGYDQLSVTGAVTLNGAELEGTFLNGFLAGVSDIFFLILNDGTDPVTGQFADGNQITIGSQVFNISYAANSDTNAFTGGNDVALQLVPEPSTALLLGLGALAMARRRRGNR